ncbi:MAG: tetratricopeptide repeat protein [Deltaproteobacteria bacterium]|nr:tetratricopeptide repeat protein [Deltaproteobacteria bacterium]
MIELDRQHLVILMEAGYVYLGMKRYDDARSVFEGVSALAPDSDVPLVALGGVHFCEGRLKEAIACYEQALKLDPGSLFAKVYLGEALLFAGRMDDGMVLLKEVEKKDGTGAAGHFASTLIDAVKNGVSLKPKGRKHVAPSKLH